MLIKRLKIENLRNLSAVEINPHPSLNIISGMNGAGKTSIIESLVILSRGRSFRTTNVEELSGEAGPSFRVFAELSADAKKTHKLGLQREGSQWRARLDGSDVRQLSHLSHLLPLVLLEPESHRMVSGAPELRRKYIDWCLFHVEHGFIDTYRAYTKLLKQRNAALRQRQLDVIESIDVLLVKQGALIDSFRCQMVKDIVPVIQQQLEILSPTVESVEISYKHGWSGETFEESLAVCLDRDLDRGSTTEGPHRAELLIKSRRKPVKQVFSRGEQKVLTASMILAQKQIVSQSNRGIIVLFDDLASEFDEDHFQRVLEKSVSGENQVWLTGTTTPALSMAHKVFHVEHGQVSEVV